MTKKPNFDHEATDFQEEESETFGGYTEEDYFTESLNSVSEVIVSDSVYNRNKYLIRNMVNDFCDRHNRQGDLPPELAAKMIESFFSSLAKYGIR